MGGSLMPAGLTDTLTRGELVDLVRFPVRVGPGRFLCPRQGARGASLAGFGSDAGCATTADEIRQRRGCQRRSSPGVESGVQHGRRLAAAGRPATCADGAAVPHRGRAQFDTSTPGAVLLRLNATKGITLWLDRKPLEAKETLEVDLTAGVHTLTIAVDASQRKESLRVELDDKPGSPCAFASLVESKWDQ